jgi:hypothetical protein
MKAARSCLAFLVLLAAGAWLVAYAGQWILRWRAKNLLADIDSIQINHSTGTEADILVAKWRKKYEVSVYRTDEDCDYVARYLHILPPMLRGYPDEGVKNYLPRLIDHIGLRSEAVIGSVRVKNGVVIEKGFGEDVALPVRVWFYRGGAFVPELAVWSGESAQFNGYEGRLTAPDAHRIARNQKGPYGVIVTFLPAEEAAERAALMDFRMSCLTRLSPCLNESEILPEGANVLEQTLALRSSAAAAAAGREPR